MITETPTKASETATVPGQSVRVTGTGAPGQDQILTPEALAFLAELDRRFGPRLTELLERRRARQLEFDRGALPDFLPETAGIREADWTVAPAPADLTKRIVEITGPVDRKMIVNALSCGADVFMADFEDSSAPTWERMIGGQLHLFDAIRRQIDFTHPDTGKRYELSPRPATLMVRPRGLHLTENHLRHGDRAMPAALVDAGLFLFHNAAELLARDSGPYFYLPKLESHLEARWWNDVLSFAEKTLSIPAGSVRATVLIETLPAAFEMDEILYELRTRSVGLNCGRWDYIFSFIKTMRSRPEFVVPDRGQVGMTQRNMRSYTQLLIKTCHRRGAHAMGGMAAQIPIKNDEDKSRVALAKVVADKEREAGDGHDGTWVAHPGLVAVARAAFDAVLGGKPNQLDRTREDVSVTADDLLSVPTGTRTDAALRENIRVGVQYLAAWLSGNGCVPLYHLMEDAATAEISRTQIWQWLRHGVDVDGEPITTERVVQATAEELEVVRAEVGDDRFTGGKYEEAAKLFLELATTATGNPDQFCEFLTLPAYPRLIESPPA